MRFLALFLSTFLLTAPSFAGTLEDQAREWNRRQVSQLVSEGKFKQDESLPPKEGETDQEKIERWLQMLPASEEDYPQ